MPQGAPGSLSFHVHFCPVWAPDPGCLLCPPLPSTQPPSGFGLFPLARTTYCSFCSGTELRSELGRGLGAGMGYGLRVSVCVCVSACMLALVWVLLCWRGGPRVCWCHSRLLITKNDVSSQWKQNPALQSRPLPSPPLFLSPCTFLDSPSSSSLSSSTLSFWVFFLFFFFFFFCS